MTPWIISYGFFAIVALGLIIIAAGASPVRATPPILWPLILLGAVVWPLLILAFVAGALVVHFGDKPVKTH